MASWGNNGEVQHDQDMEPDGNYKLKVDINRDCNAIEACNPNVNGRGLKVEGRSEFDGDILTTAYSHST